MTASRPSWRRQKICIRSTSERSEVLSSMWRSPQKCQALKFSWARPRAKTKIPFNLMDMMLRITINWIPHQQKHSQIKRLAWQFSMRRTKRKQARSLHCKKQKKSVLNGLELMKSWRRIVIMKSSAQVISRNSSGLLTEKRPSKRKWRASGERRRFRCRGSQPLCPSLKTNILI